MKLNGEVEFLSKVSALDVANFTKHMSVMLKAGITVADALDTLSKQTSSPKLRKILEQTLKDVSNGSPLSTSFEKTPKVFDAFYTNIIKVGEESGSLAKNLEYLAQKLEKEIDLQKKIKGALFYPEMVVGGALIVGLGLSIFVLPKMGDLFNSFNMQLPFATRMLLAFSAFMKKYNVLVPIALVGVFLIFRLIISLKPVRPHWARFIISLPIIGKFIIAEQTALICRNLGIMLESSMPIARALEITEATTGNYVFKGYIANLRKATDAGEQIGTQLINGKYKLMPTMAARMISIGEKSGKLNDMLLYLGEYYEAETDDLTKNLSSVIEPVLLLFLGVIVSVVALAIVSPIYQITGSIKQ